MRGVTIQHVKPHGALYNMAAKHKNIANAIAKAIADFDRNIMLYGLSGSCLITAAKEIGITAISEVFADRTYSNDGTLTPRTASNALITDEHISLQQVLQMIKHSEVTTTDNKTIPIVAETICLHSDGMHAVTLATSIYYMLKSNQIVITAKQ